MSRSVIGIFLGPVLCALILLAPLPEGMSPEAMKVAAVAVLMAVWWVTEAIPIAATALLPIALFPLLGVMGTAEAARPYAHHLVFLFLGGFLLAVTMQKWNLHKRIAMHTIRLVGTSPDRMILGFMLATAFLSMWISNTATTMMMLPVSVAVIAQVGLMHQEHADATGQKSAEDPKFGVCLMLSIAYSASIGGVATLIGTPPNAVLAGMADELYGLNIGFADWMLFAFPLSAIMLVICWLYLTRFGYRSNYRQLPGAREIIHDELARLGRMSREEKWVLVVFLSVSAGWIGRGFLDIEALKGVKDATIAIIGALALFIIPSNLAKREFLLDWRTASTIPWDIIILFGGGFALAGGFASSGLTAWLADHLTGLEGANLVVLIAAVTLLVIFLTEVTSNTATATMLVPLMGAMAVAIDVNPMMLMVPAAIAASYAFMLPVATPPNAIVFGSKLVSIPQMVRAGLWLNLTGVALITLYIYFVMPHVEDLFAQPAIDPVIGQIDNRL